MKNYRCAICEREIEYDGPLPAVYPFCSPRCKWVDLGRWFQGDYRIEREADVEDLPPGAAAGER